MPGTRVHLVERLGHSEHIGAAMVENRPARIRLGWPHSGAAVATPGDRQSERSSSLEFELFCR
jgi:hypothetical protein